VGFEIVLFVDEGFSEDLGDDMDGFIEFLALI
jgi:hypothetical protein